ncbi:MAG: M23 family metallopeptidase [Patescibacteria group bacterium]
MIGKRFPLGTSLFLVFSLISIANLVSPDAFFGDSISFNGGKTIGGEITEIVSAPKAVLKENLVSQSVSTVLAFEISAGPDIGLEGAFYEDRYPLITGNDSILQNQNPTTTVLPDPKPVTPVKPALPYYAAGPYLDGYFISPTTGYNRGVLHAYNAVDISMGDLCVNENIPVYATASGVISAAYTTESINRYAAGGYGNNITILHPNGVVTRYAHLKSVLVTVGQYVNQGSIIAYMGGYPYQPGSGNSTGCHLHYEVRGAKNPLIRY